MDNQTPNEIRDYLAVEVLPEDVKVCWCCKGKGEYRQTYTAGCGMGSYSALGDCEYCKRTGYLYKSTGKAVPPSVVTQIKNTNPKPSAAC